MITAPTDFSGLQVWLDASDTTRLFQLSGGTTAVVANGDPVGYWGDKSGNARHFTNIGGSATTRPTWVSSLSTVRFDGSNDWLQSFFSVTYTAQTVFLAIKYNVHVTDSRIYSQTSSANTSDAANTTNQYVPVNFSNVVQYAARIRVSGVEQSGAGVTPRSSGIFDIFSATHSGTVIRHFLNGTTGATLSHPAGLNIPVVQTRLGNNTSGGGAFFNGDISEVIVYNRALTNNERADVEYYLTRKWNFLNSIPRQVYGIKNGLWSLSDTWSVSAEPSPWNYPLSADNAYTNTFTITADSSTRVDTIRNSTLAPNILSGGSFMLANGVSLSANVPLASHSSPQLVTLLPSATANFYGVINGNTSTTPVVVVPQNTTFTLYGSAYNGSTSTLSGNIVNFGTTNIFGDVLSPNGSQGGNTNSTAILNTNLLNIAGKVNSNSQGNTNTAGFITNIGTTTVNITGDVTLQYVGFRSLCILNPTFVNIIGNVTALGSQNQNGAIQGASIVNMTGNASGPAFRSVTTVNLTGSFVGGTYGNTESVTNFNMSSGNIFASTAATPVQATNASLLNVDLYANNSANAINVTSLTATNCNIINAPNGRQAIYAPRYQVFSTGSAQYTRQASNGYGSYVDYWTSNSTFSYPASSDVALGTTYSNSTLSGSMAVPSPSSVALGAPVGTTTGTASITFDNVLSQPIANLTTPNSIGARLKNITTSQALSAIVDSLEF